MISNHTLKSEQKYQSIKEEEQAGAELCQAQVKIRMELIFLNKVLKIRHFWINETILLT